MARTDSLDHTASTPASASAWPVAVPVLAGATALALHAMGAAGLGAPPVNSLSSFTSWVDQHGAVPSAVAIGRIVALGFAYHLLAASALAVLGRLTRRVALVDWAQRLTVPAFRVAMCRLAGAGVGAGLGAAGLGLATAAVGGAVLSAPGPAAAALPPEDGGDHDSTVAMFAYPQGLQSEVTLELLGPSDETPGKGVATMVMVDAGPDRPEPRAPADGSESAGSGREHVVEPGDHLWSLAEQELRSQMGGEPTEDQVERYWAAVVVSNPDLVDPGPVVPRRHRHPSAPGDRLNSPAPPVTPPAGYGIGPEALRG